MISVEEYIQLAQACHKVFKCGKTFRTDDGWKFIFHPTVTLRAQLPITEVGVSFRQLIFGASSRLLSDG